MDVCVVGILLILTSSKSVVNSQRFYQRPALAGADTRWHTDYNYNYQHSNAVQAFSAAPGGATMITPVKAIASFFDDSRIGFSTGPARGTISFAQANYPSNPATVIQMVFYFPPSRQDRVFKVEVLYAGDIDPTYCESAKRYVEVGQFKLLAGEIRYASSYKRYDVNIIDEAESIIGCGIRVICSNCEQRRERVAGCTVVARADDEVYTESEDEREREVIPMSPTYVDFLPGSRRLTRYPVISPRYRYVAILT